MPGRKSKHTLRPSSNADRQFRWLTQCLVDHAVALGQFLQRRPLLGSRRRIEIKTQPDFLEADRHFLTYTQRPAKIEVALSADRAAAQRDVERRRHRSQRYAGTSDQGFEQHVA